MENSNIADALRQIAEYQDGVTQDLQYQRDKNTELRGVIATLRADNERLKRELARAVADLNGLTTAFRCTICKHYEPPKDKTKPDYYGKCTAETRCTLGNSMAGFEWRGLAGREGTE